MKVILIRHGKTAGNLEKRYIGRTDEELCEQGQRELKAFSEKYKGLGVEKIFSSPMKRCIETAQILFPELVSTAGIIEDFKETDFGLFEGKNYEELKDNPDYIKWLESNGTCGFPEGETREQAAERTLRGFDLFLDKAFDSGVKVTGAVVHGGTIMNILWKYCGGDFYDYQVMNGEGFVFEVYRSEDGKIQIEGLRKF